MGNFHLFLNEIENVSLFSGKKAGMKRTNDSEKMLGKGHGTLTARKGPNKRKILLRKEKNKNESPFIVNQEPV